MFDIELPSFSFSASTPQVTELSVAESLTGKQAELAELKAIIGLHLQSMKMYNTRLGELTYDQDEEYASLDAKLTALRETIFDAKRQVQALSREIDALATELRLIKEKERTDAREKEIAERNERTLDFKWRGSIMPHQLDGAYTLSEAHKAILGDKMGLGKSITSLAAADLCDSQRLLIISPADVVRNFAREVEKWAPHRTAIPMYKMNKGARDALLHILSTQTSYTLLINYEIWRDDFELLNKLIDLRFDTVICDEAHNIKSLTSIAYTGVKRVVMAENSCPICGDKTEGVSLSRSTISLQCVSCSWNNSLKDNPHKWKTEDTRSIKQVFLMSGTPILNKPQELFPLLHLILPTVFVKVKDFLNLYCVQDYDTGYWQFRAGALSQLSAHLNGRYLARDRSVLPPGSIPTQEVKEHLITFDVDKYPNQWRVMTQLTKHAQIMMEESEQQHSVLSTIALITRKRQANVYPAGIIIRSNKDVVFSVGDEVQESIKLDYAIKLIQEAGDDRVVLFSQFAGALRALQSRLESLGVASVAMTGETTEKVREQVKQDFDRNYCNEPGYRKKWQVVLCHYKTGGVGLNFTDATQMIVLDDPWNPGTSEQAYGRIDRIGQTEETTVHVIRIEKTIDDWLAKLNDFKKGVVSGFEQATEATNLANSMMEAMANGDMV